MHIHTRLQYAIMDGIRAAIKPTPENSDLRWAIQRGIETELEKLDESHEVRGLRWKLKNLGRANGKQGQKIYDLRCQLAEARSLISVDATAYRKVREEAAAGWRRVAEQNELIRQLQLQLRGASNGQHASNGELATAKAAVSSMRGML